MIICPFRIEWKSRCILTKAEMKTNVSKGYLTENIETEHNFEFDEITLYY